MTINIEQLPYRPGVGIMLINTNKQVFVAKRIDMRTEAWQMPQGGIDSGETPQAAALRELKEEIGTDKAQIIAETAKWLHYDLPVNLVPKVWGGSFRGQRQKWFLMHFTGNDDDIDINTQHPEFCQWQWVNPKELPTLIVPFKQQLYTDILQEFAPHLSAA